MFSPSKCAAPEFVLASVLRLKDKFGDRLGLCDGRSAGRVLGGERAPGQRR